MEREYESSPAYSHVDEELMEVLTRAVAKLNIDRPAGEVESDSNRKSLLDDRYLPSKLRPPRRELPFFPDLHTEVSRSWNKPVSFRVHNPQTSNYSKIKDISHYGYLTLPPAGETLASHLSPETASSLKAPTLPTKPLKATSSLVGKAYSAAGQAAACLHTMSILQAYQADLLKDMDNCEEVSADTIRELRRATDLSLRATKETAKSVGRSMAALVATEHNLWLNLSDIKDKDWSVLLDAPLSPTSLFGDAINCVVDRFQETKKQSAALQKFLPRRSIVSETASRVVKPEQSRPSASSSQQHRVQQKQSVAARAPPQPGESGWRSQSKPVRGRQDLRTVISKRAWTKKKS